MNALPAQTIMETLVPIYLVLLGLLTLLTGLFLRESPTTEARLSFGIFAGSSLSLVIQLLLGVEEPVRIALSLVPVVMPSMALVALVALRTGVPFRPWPWVGFAVATTALAAVLIAWGAPFWGYALPMACGIAMPALYWLVRSAPGLRGTLLPTRVLWVVAVLWSLHWLDFPFLRLHASPTVGLAGFSLALVLCLLAGLTAPAIAAEAAGREAARHRSEQLALQQRTEATAAHLAQVAHELRNPLNAIIGYTELLEEAVEDGAGAEEVGGDIDRIVRAGNHLGSLVDDVLDLSKVAAGRLDITLAETSVEELFADVRAATQGLASRNDNQLVFEGPVGTRGAIDPVRVRQCLINLVGNAAKFTHGGSITVRFRPGRRWAFDVVDTGIGISPEAQQRLFQVFSQADASIRERFGGSGLGLALSRQLALRMGGDIQVASRVGEGSTFTLQITPGVA